MSSYFWYLSQNVVVRWWSCAASGPLCKAKPKPLVQKTRMQWSRNQILPFTNIYQNSVAGCWDQTYNHLTMATVYNNRDVTWSDWKMVLTWQVDERYRALYINGFSQVSSVRKVEVQPICLTSYMDQWVSGKCHCLFSKWLHGCSTYCNIYSV